MRPVPSEAFASGEEASAHDAARCRTVSDDLLRREGCSSDAPVLPGACLYRRGRGRPDPGIPSLIATTPLQALRCPDMFMSHTASCQAEQSVMCHAHTCTHAHSLTLVATRTHT